MHAGVGYFFQRDAIFFCPKFDGALIDFDMRLQTDVRAKHEGLIFAIRPAQNPYCILRDREGLEMPLIRRKRERDSKPLTR